MMSSTPIIYFSSILIVNTIKFIERKQSDTSCHEIKFHSVGEKHSKQQPLDWLGLLELLRHITAKASPSSSVINEAARLRSEKRDNDVFVEYLQEMEFLVTTQQAETTIPDQSSDEGSYSAKSYNQKKDLTTNINIVQKGQSTQVDGFFKWRVSGGVKGANRGASPDVVSIHWNKEKFKLNNTSSYEDWNEDRLTLYDTNGRKHAVWKFDDSHVGPGAIYDGAVKIEVQPSNPGPDPRFYLKYYHTWGK